MPTLLEQLRTVIRRKHYAMRTEDAYVGWVRDFIRFHDKRHPASLAEGHVTRYLSHLAVERRVSASTQNQALSALLFLYRNVLDRPLGDISGAVRAKQPQRLPVVFTQDEVTGPLERLQGPTWLICALLYGAGLRLLEGLRLRVKDPEFERQAIYVRDGKGAKDRVTVLPADLTESLQRHLANVQTTFERDRTRGLAGVYVPFALARKYPDAPIEWRWQWVLPAPGTSVDPREQLERRHHLSRCNARSGTRCDRPTSTNTQVPTRCGTASPLTCSKAATTFAPCRSYSVTPTSKPRRSTPMC